MSTESRFCDRCGETLPSPESRFCSACGSSQSQGNDEAVETSTVSTVPTRSQYGGIKAIKPKATRWFRMPHWILVIVGSAVLLVGVGSLNEGTEGLGFVAIACFLGIMARIAQAEWHERAAKGDMSED